MEKKIFYSNKRILVLFEIRTGSYLKTVGCFPVLLKQPLFSRIQTTWIDSFDGPSIGAKEKGMGIEYYLLTYIGSYVIMHVYIFLYLEFI